MLNLSSDLVLDCVRTTDRQDKLTTESLRYTSIVTINDANSRTRILRDLFVRNVLFSLVNDIRFVKVRLELLCSACFLLRREESVNKRCGMPQVCVSLHRVHSTFHVAHDDTVFSQREYRINSGERRTLSLEGKTCLI